MHDLIESIRTALAAEASAEQRAAGVAACRTILRALDATPGEPLTAEPTNASPLAAILGALRGVPPDQLLDLAIAKLRAALPADAQVPRAVPLKFQLVPLPR